MNWSIPERESGNGSLLVLSNFVYLAIFKTPENQLNPTGQKMPTCLWDRRWASWEYGMLTNGPNLTRYIGIDYLGAIIFLFFVSNRIPDTGGPARAPSVPGASRRKRRACHDRPDPKAPVARG